MSKKLSWTWFWYTGAVATTLQASSRWRRREQVALFVSATGNDAGTITLVTDLLQHSSCATPWKVYCVTAQNPPNHGDNKPAASVTYIQCDISNPYDVCKKLSPLADVTHLFYVAWPGEADQRCDEEVSSDEFRNVIRTVMAVCPKLKHVGLRISRRHCSGGCKLRVSTVTGSGGRLPPIDEDDDDDTSPRNSALEDVLVEEVGKKPTVKWAVHHPNRSTTPTTSTFSTLATGSVVESEHNPDSKIRCRDNDGVFEFRDVATVQC